MLVTSCNNQAAHDEKMKDTTHAPVAVTRQDTITDTTLSAADQHNQASSVKQDTLSMPHHVALILIVNNLSASHAPVIVGVYGRQNKYPDVNDQLKHYKFIPDSNMMIKQITDLDYGDFALAIYQDLNNDGKINRNFLGIPTEPYAFSNNYRPLIKAPSFNDCRFTYGEKTNTIIISMIKSN